MACTLACHRGEPIPAERRFPPNTAAAKRPGFEPLEVPPPPNLGESPPGYELIHIWICL